MKKILLFKLGAIGDVLMTTPFVRQLKLGLGKDSHITYMVGGRSSEVLTCNKYIDDLLRIEDDIFSKRRVRKRFQLIVQLRKISKQGDTVFVLDKHWIVHFTLRLGGFRRRIGLDLLGKRGKFLTDRIYRDASKREVDYYLDLLIPVGIQANYDDQVYDPQLSRDSHVLDEKTREKIDNFMATLKATNKKIIGISTGGGSKLSPAGDCRWRSLNKREELANKLLLQGDTILLLGSGADRSLDIKNKNLINLLGKYSILETMYIISKLDFVVCQESGFAHFVGCTDTSMLALAGPTNPYRFYPYITGAEKHPAGWIWKCEKECYDVYGGYSACKGNEMEKINVEDVLNFIIKYKK